MRIGFRFKIQRRTAEIFAKVKIGRSTQQAIY